MAASTRVVFSCALGIVAVLASVATSSVAALPVFTEHFVTNTGDSGPGSLRQVIIDANNDATDSDILFAIPGDGPHIIQPLSELPSPAESTTISAVNLLKPDGEPTIILDGSLTTFGPGLRLTQSHCAIRGLTIRRWKSPQIYISGAGSNFVTSCHIEASPEVAAGIYIDSSPNNVIGGAASSEGNVICGNGFGIQIFGENAAQNRVWNNRIGTDRTGIQAIPNGIGILLNGTSRSNEIGGPDRGNVVSGNRDEGIYCNISHFNYIRSNFIGVAAGGFTGLPNNNGIRITDGEENHIGGPASGEGNVISGNTRPVSGSNVYMGILIEGAQSTRNEIKGNRIGTDVSGMAAVPNGIGIYMTAGPHGNAVGGALPREGNLISGNAGDGITIGGSANSVQRNIIGLAGDGLTPLQNFVGIQAGGDDTLISRNIISGNFVHGVQLTADRCSVQGNLIGVNISGEAAANGGNGMALIGAERSTIGSTFPGLGNVIAGNGFDGVSVTLSSDNVFLFNSIGVSADGSRVIPNLHDGLQIHSGERNQVIGNSIAGNQNMGIDLGNDGVTPNDTGDADTGPNGLQNYPVLTAASVSPEQLQMSGTFTSMPNTTYILTFYLNDSPDSSGHGEGQRQFYSQNMSLGPEGFVQWSTGLPAPSVPGRWVTATASDLSGNTSEFSNAIELTGRDPTTLEIVDAILGLIPMQDSYNLNGVAPVDAGDVVTSVNASP